MYAKGGLAMHDATLAILTISWQIFVFFASNLTFTVLTRARTCNSHAYIRIATLANVVIFFISFRILFAGGEISWHNFWPFLVGNMLGNDYGIKIAAGIEKRFGISLAT